MKLGAVIVAAGLSSRMGAFKPLLPIGGSTAIESIIGTLKSAGVEDIVCVTGFNAKALEAVLKPLGVICIRNERYAETQMFDSVRMGFSFIVQQCERLLFTPADVPLFSLETVRRLLKSKADIAIPVCESRDGHPLAISSAVLPKILTYSGNEGLHGALLACGGSLERVFVSDTGAVSDMDTPADYERLLRHSV